jgi:hypothetical protein
MNVVGQGHCFSVRLIETHRPWTSSRIPLASPVLVALAAATLAFLPGESSVALPLVTFVGLPLGAIVAVASVLMLRGRYGTDGREPLRHWRMANLLRLTLYFLVACLVVGVFYALASDGQPLRDRTGEIVGNAVLVTIYGGAGCALGAIVWLHAISIYPAMWSRRRRRVVALATTPIIGAYWTFFFVFGVGGIRSWSSALFFGIVLPLGSGLVVRWPRQFGLSATSDRVPATREVVMR